jgi:twitching motility protein PilI
MTGLGVLDERALGAASPGDLERCRETWRGLTFCVSGAPLVVAIDDIEEVIRYPTVSRVPGAPSWLHGLASWRGQPMAVVGLARFLGGEDGGFAGATRVLVVRRGAARESRVGAVVDRVEGLRPFAAPAAAVPGWRVTPWIRPWLSGWRQLDHEDWGVLELMDLFSRPEFTHALA